MALLIVLGITLGLGLRPLRERLLPIALGRLDAALPGDLRVQRARWPALGSLVLTGVGWTAADTTLASADEVAVRIALRPLWRGDVVLDRLSLRTLQLDMPAVQRRFAARSDAAPEAGNARRFPRPGALPGMPSVAIDSLHVDAVTLQLPGVGRVDSLAMDATIDLRHGRVPRLRLSGARAHGPPAGWSVDSLALDVDLARGRASGHGAGRIQARWPVRLGLATDAADHLVLQISEVEGVLPPEAMGIVARARIARHGLAVDSLAFTATVRTPGTVELARVPALAAWLRARPASSGVQFEAMGTLAFAPLPSLSLGATFVPGDLVQAGTLQLRREYDRWTLRCDTLDVADVHLRGQMHGDVDSLAASLWLDVLGRRWQDWLGAQRGPAWTVRAHVDFRQRRDTATAALGLRARGTLAGHAIDHLGLDGTVGLTARTPSILRLQVASHGVHAGLAAHVQRGDTLRLQLSPLRLQATADGLDAAAIPAQEPPTLLFVPGTGRIVLTDLQIRGDAGDADLNADLTLQDGGNIAARLAWPRFPALLSPHVAPTTAAALRAHWQADAPYTFGLDAVAGPRLERVDGTGTFSLPGPGNAAGIVPSLRVDDLGALAGTLRFEVATADSGRWFELSLDGAHTPWLDTLRVQVTGSGRALQVHEARLDMENLRIDLRGALGADELDLRAHLDVRDAGFLQRFFPAPADSMAASSPIQELTLRGDATIAGSRAHPTVSGDLGGRLVAWGLEVPEFQTHVERDTTGLRVQWTSPRGFRGRGFALESVRALVNSPATSGWTPLTIVLDVIGRDFAWQQSARVVATSPWSVAVDRLRLVVGDKDLVAKRPFRVAIDKDRLHVDDLTLGGSLGSFAATGVASRDSTRFSAHAALDLPEPPAALGVRRDLWPRRVRASLESSGSDSLHAALTIGGFRLAGSLQPELHAECRTQPRRLSAIVSLADTATMLRGDATLPVQLQLWPPRAAILDGAVRADVGFARLPFAIHTSRAGGPFGAEDVGRLAGRLVLGGTADTLAAYTDVQLRFPDTPNLAPFTLAVRAHAGRDARADSLWRATLPDTTSPEITGTDLVMGFVLLSETLPLVRGEARLPLHVTLVRPFVRADSSGALALRIRAEEVPLAACNPLLPRRSALQGKTTITLAADGRLGSARLDGSLTTSDVELSLGDGSRIVFVTRAQLSGVRRHPVLRGDIEVKTALIKVPEAQKNLHPASGDALLQSALVADTPAAVLDSLDADSLAAHPAATRAAAKPPALAQSDIDIRIRIPRELWVRGRGLDLEGKGDLQISQHLGRPTVAGTLQGVRGTYSIAGRTLLLDRATVRFQGDTQVSPTLDVQLSTAISGTKIRVLVGGTAAAPELTLSSDPEMEQSDIIALLALGKTYDELSDEESGIMRERATAILVSMGAAALQENVTQDLGIDVVQYRSNAGAPGAKSASDNQSGSLAFGKYLSPKVLLSYSYSLDRAVDDIVSLEYFLKGQLTLETLYSVKGQSGLGFGWTMEY